MVVTAFYAFNAVDFLSRAVQTKAVVIDHYYVLGGGGYVPIVRFVDALGVEHITKGNLNALDFLSIFQRNLPRIGDELDIMYDTDNPEGDFWTTSNVWSNTQLVLAVCIVFTAFVLFYIWVGLVLNKEKNEPYFVTAPKKGDFAGKQVEISPVFR